MGLIFHADHYLRSSEPVKQLSQDQLHLFIYFKSSFHIFPVGVLMLADSCVMMEVYDDDEVDNMMMI